LPVTLARLRLEPEAAAGIWRELGHDLALLHRSFPRRTSHAPLDERRPFPDPRELADSIAEQGWITESEANWLRQWLERIAPLALTPVEAHLIHCDSQATNVMVDEASLSYVAVLDWGSCGWGDPAWDFAGIPLRAVPQLLDGYRAVGPLPADETAEARILWRHVQLALHSVPRGPQPDYSWAERPLTMLLEIARFFFSDPGDPWRDLRPD
jgi:aminoglycoside phosphotransferase (APT) family kinase protein